MEEIFQIFLKFGSKIPDIHNNDNNNIEYKYYFQVILPYNLEKYWSSNVPLL